TSEWARDELRVVARLADVLGRNPDARPVNNGRAVVAPAGTRGVDAEGGGVVGEAIVRADAGLGDVNAPDAGLRVEAGVCRARVVARPNQREGHHAGAVVVDRQRRIAQVRVRQARVATTGQLGVNAAAGDVRSRREPLDACPDVAVDIQSGVKSSV